MFVGATAVQTAFTIADLLEWLIPVILIFCGFKLLKKQNKSKAIKILGTLLASAGIFLLLWMVLWQVVAIIVYLC